MERGTTQSCLQGCTGGLSIARADVSRSRATSVSSRGRGARERCCCLGRCARRSQRSSPCGTSHATWRQLFPVRCTGRRVRSEDPPPVRVCSQSGGGAQASSSPLDKLETCVLLAKTLYQGRRCREALSIVESAVSRFPTATELLHLRGLCLQATNNLPAVRGPIGGPGDAGSALGRRVRPRGPRLCARASTHPLSVRMTAKGLQELSIRPAPRAHSREGRSNGRGVHR